LTKHTWNENNESLRHEAPGATATYKRDIFSFSNPINDVPHESETAYAFNDPQSWAGRVSDRTVIHFGSGTLIASETYLGTTRTLLKDQAAVEELHAVCTKMQPFLQGLGDAFQAYQTGAPDGFITSAGFLSVCAKVGVVLERSEFLALERSVTKEIGGRLSWRQVLDVIESVSIVGPATAPIALSQSLKNTLNSPM